MSENNIPSPNTELADDAAGGPNPGLNRPDLVGPGHPLAQEIRTAQVGALSLWGVGGIYSFTSLTIHPIAQSPNVSLSLDYHK